MSISASLSEARTPTANIEGRRQVEVICAEIGTQEGRENTLQGPGQWSRTEKSKFWSEISDGCS